MDKNLTMLTTPKTVRKRQMVSIIRDGENVKLEVVKIANKSIIVKDKETKVTKRAFWSDRKKRYCVEGKYVIL